MLNEKQTVPSALEQCTIWDPIENTHGVLFYSTLEIILPYLAKPRRVLNY
jgi:hypothetical protein